MNSANVTERSCLSHVDCAHVDCAQADLAQADLAQADLVQAGCEQADCVQASCEQAEYAQVEALAREMLEQTRETLAMAFRYLDVALWHMPFAAREFDAPLATDGITLFFDPYRVVLRFRESPDDLVRDYLHLLLHCIFRQPFQVGFPDWASWSTACDVTSELTAWEMCNSRFPCAHDFELEDLFSTLKKALGAITPLKVYRELVAYRYGVGASVFDGIPRDAVQRWLDELVVRDSHIAWEHSKYHNLFEGGESVEEGAGDELIEQRNVADLINGGNANGNGDDQDDSQDADDGNDEGEGEESNSPKRKTKRDLRDDAHSSRIEPKKSAAAQEEWDGIYKQVEMDLRTAALQEAETAGMLVAQIELAKRKPVDYEAFLRSFASTEEDLRINDEEFDYIFYMFGFDMYGNMPLIDPLEYQEVSCVREFVIAIDTSASCKGELVTNFLTRTCEILQNTAQFGRDVNIHIIQCDARVQDDVVITSLDQLSAYTSDLHVKGLGGTDFRPVFEHVNDLVDRGEFENLRGLIYFTDGKGTYPEHMPPYDTAFVFLEEDGIPVRVPPWAMKVVLDEDGIRTI